MRQYDLSISFRRFLLNHLKTAAGSAFVLAALLVGVNQRYGVDWVLLASIFIGFSILMVVLQKARHKSDLRDSHLEIHDEIIKWRHSGIEEVFNIGSIRDVFFISAFPGD